MVNIDDLEELAEPSEVTYSQPKSTLLSKYNIPLSWLDFDYIDKCNNAREVEKILHILQSGEEGHYPQLIESAETKLQLLKPNSKFLRKQTPVLNSQYLNEDARICLKNDLSDFVETMGKNDAELTTLKSRQRDDIRLPKVRKTIRDVPIEKACPKSNTNRNKATDYSTWDKYDADTEMLKLDLQEQRLHLQVEKEERVTEKYKPKKSVHFKRNLTEAEAIYEADREREKGNEYYKAGEYLGAYNYYSRSITCKQTVPALTNRALVSLKLLRFHDVIEDCQNALNEEPDNVKAQLRLGLGFEGLKQYEKALNQAEIIIKIDPNNIAAQTLANNCYKLLKRRENLKSTRLEIIEVSDEEKNPRNNKKAILKKHKEHYHQNVKKKNSPKSPNYTIVPIPGPSTMKPPYYIKVDKMKNTKIIMRDDTAIQNQLLLHMNNLCNNSDDDYEGDDDDCTVMQIDPHKKSNKSKEHASSKQEPCGEIVQSFDEKRYNFISEGDNCKENQEIDLNCEQIDKNCNRISKSNQQMLATRDSEELRELLNKKNLPVNDLLNSEEKNKQDSTYQVDNEKIDVDRNLLTINMNPQVEVLAARTTARASSEEKGGSGEPDPHTTEVRDDVHMPYIFTNTWNCLKTDRSFAHHASILRTLDLRNLPQIIGCKLDGTMLSEILETAYRHMTVVDEVWRVHDLITALPRIPRYSAVRLFMSDLDRTYLNNLIQFLEQHGTSISKELHKELLPLK